MPASQAAASAAAPLLEVDDLVVRFETAQGTVHAVEDVSFTIGRGETLGLVGESGSGKTTIGFTVLRVHAPVRGRILFDGRDLAGVDDRELRQVRRKMQVVFQDPYSSLNPRMRVGDIIGEPLVVHEILPRGAELRLRVRELLERCGLPGEAVDRYPSAFSGGQRQRIAIARALALNPRLIVADEPVSALDVSTQAQIVNLLVDLQQDEKLAYLFISHDLAVVRHIAHRIMVLYAGKVMELSPTDELFARPLNPYTQALLAASPTPDPKIERQRERIVLRGEVPSVLSPPRGCRFNTRCPLAAGPCFEEMPPLTEKAPGRWSACWHV